MILGAVGVFAGEDLVGEMDLARSAMFIVSLVRVCPCSHPEFHFHAHWSEGLRRAARTRGREGSRSVEHQRQQNLPDRLA